MRTIKIIFISLLVAASAGLMNLGDSSAYESGVDKVTVSKDVNPNFESLNLTNLGTMTASWYGPKFHGRLTANGEIYNQLALTAASKTMPFGTFLKVTNLRNGKSAVIRINDRGPYIEGRDLDLSKGTAITLGMIKRGVIKIKVEEINPDSEISPVTTLE